MHPRIASKLRNRRLEVAVVTPEGLSADSATAAPEKLCHGLQVFRLRCSHWSSTAQWHHLNHLRCFLALLGGKSSYQSGTIMGESQGNDSICEATLKRQQWDPQVVCTQRLYQQCGTSAHWGADRLNLIPGYAAFHSEILLDVEEFPKSAICLANQ